jgi:ribonucleoside-diphosphate reductase alpha chain
MMAAAQPFLSGAISKTINMPEDSTVEDIMQAYIESWKLGVKAVAIYRDNSKGSQPLSAAGDKKDTAQQTQPAPTAAIVAAAKPVEPAAPGIAEQQELFVRSRRRKMPSERQSITHKFSIGGHEGYITVGMYESGEPGEIFIKMAKEGSTLSGFMDGFALSVSIGLQYGVPLKTLVDKFINTRFEPAGYTGHPAIPYAKSVLDYLGRWLGGRFISPDYLTHSGEASLPAATIAATPAVPPAFIPTADDDPSPASARSSATNARSDSRPMFDGAPTCSECGMLMTPNGACYKCENCGGTSGCS